MAKPVASRCNLACSYCYYLETGHDDPWPPQARMTADVLEAFIRQYIQASPGPAVPFTWHGGEPTLAGVGFYRRALELQRKHLPAGWECWNNLQTNGVLLDDEWCAFLAKARFDVGLSIDGTKDLHDRFRKDRGGNGSYERVVVAIRRLQAHGIRPDLLCTVTSNAAQAPLAVYRALRAFHTGWIQFIPIVRRSPDGQVTPDSVTPEGYGGFLCRVFDEWVRHDLGRLDVQLFAETARVWAGGAAGLCWMRATCGRALIVERDGSVYSCDHFVDAAHRIGDIQTSTLRALADSPEQHRFGDSKRDALTAQCQGCPWLAVCGGGCLKDRFAVSDDGEPGQYYLCGGLRRFFAHARRPLELAMEMSRHGKSPEAIMAAMPAPR
jgi:uncharacterized protein